MTDTKETYRRWLARQQPNDVEAQADLEETLAVAHASRRMRWVPALAIAAAAIGIVVLAIRSRDVGAPQRWNVVVDLHVNGQPSHSDVHIRVGERRAVR